MSERRRRARLEKEWDMSLFIPSQGHRDDGAEAFDLTAAGFAVRTRLRLEPGRRIEFGIQIPGRRKVSGAGKVVWVHELRGRQVAGVEIVKLSKRGALTWRLAVDPEGGRFLRVAGNAAAGLLCGAAVLAAERLLRGGSPLPEGAGWLYPYLGAAGMTLSVALFLYFRLGESQR